MNEQEANAEAVRLTRESKSLVYVPVELPSGEWDVAPDKAEKVGLLRSLGRAIRDGTYG